MLIRLVTIGISLMIGNFLYQALTAERWGFAAEVSYFQAVALILVFIWFHNWKAP